jgi:hypothetical protein
MWRRRSGSFADTRNLLYAIDAFDLTDQVFQVMGIVDIKHYCTFKSSGIAVDIDRPDIDIIFTGDKVGKVV